ncbi:chemotaxis protein methyltransferase WspC [Paraburkholderia sp. GAS41]|jgi:chemotaxis protein methyltransferase WspC|uniref:CheR family methyltransferase n=1 Tax=Paraburkholderia sp. GAS41 TaxID=3035134 RepID=UPI003D2481B1
MNATDPCFAAWLSQETGIDAHSLGINALERAVLERVRTTRAGSAAAGSGDATVDAAVDTYWQHLNDSPDERLALIEALVVPETWFFRDREAFVALARLANEKLARDPARVLRVLSVPCSSGEEPYSVAMALLDAGIGPERFSIDAIDISARVIELAQRAVYGRNSFRGGEYAFRERHFSSTEGGWVLNERVQQTVRFAQANLFESSHNGGARYDVIFCRNVLIYFHRDAQDRAIQILDGRLAEDGTIFVGPAETGLMMRHALSSARIPLAFAFQRTPPEEAAPRSVASFGKIPDARVTPAAGTALHSVYGTTRPAATPAVAPVRVRAPVSNVPVPAVSAPAPAPACASASASSLVEARRLADAGQFDKAEHEAQQFVILNGTDAEAFYLLGLIADARGRSADASDYYRKTLYLDPAHYEALTHLATLLDMTGDSAGAQQLMRRAQRAAARMPATQDMTDTPLNSPRGAHGTRRH